MSADGIIPGSFVPDAFARERIHELGLDVVVFTNETATERLRAWPKDDGWSLERSSRQTDDHPWGRATCSSIRGTREALARHADALGLEVEVPAAATPSFSDPGDGYDSGIRWHADFERGNL